MIARAILLGACFLFILAPWARGAAWDSSLEPVSPPLLNATLGVTSRNAAVTPDGVVHLVYQNSLTVDRFQLMYTSRNAAGTWSNAVAISPDSVSARNASLAVDHEGRVHVLCEFAFGTTEDIAHVVRDTDGSWSAPEFVAPSPGFSRSPAASVDSFDKLHLVWVDGRDSVQRILHATWTAGSGWRPYEVLSLGGITPLDPAIDTDQLGGIHVFWSDRVITNTPDVIWDIFYDRLDAASSTIPTPKDLVRASSTAVHPCVEALDDGTVYLVWLDSRASNRGELFEIYFKRFLPGIGWGRDKRFTYDRTNHARPVIVSAGRTLNVVWEDFRFGSPDIFYRQITPETGWDRDETPLTTDESASQSPTLIAEPNGRLLLVWSGAQDGGTFRIFVREGTASSAP